jgi:hypothetical protein
MLRRNRFTHLSLHCLRRFLKWLYWFKYNFVWFNNLASSNKARLISRIILILWSAEWIHAIIHVLFGIPLLPMRGTGNIPVFFYIYTTYINERVNWPNLFLFLFTLHMSFT